MEFRGTIKGISSTKRYGQDGVPRQIVRVTIETELTAETAAKLQLWAEHETVLFGLTLPGERPRRVARSEDERERSQRV